MTTCVPLKDIIIVHATKSQITVHVPKSDRQISNTGLSTHVARCDGDALYRHLAVSCRLPAQHQLRPFVSEYWRFTHGTVSRLSITRLDVPTSGFLSSGNHRKRNPHRLVPARHQG
jgi:hypothetical protein